MQARRRSRDTRLAESAIASPKRTEEPLVEREAELERLGALIGAAVAGRGAVAVIEGPPGIGKTRLLEAARAEARERELQVLAARGGDLERDVPFGIARQLFERRLRRAEPATRASLLEGPAAIGGRAILAGELADAGDLADAGAPADAYAALHGLYWLTSNLCAESPALLVVDDAHWSDPPSLRFLDYLARRIDDLHTVLVLSVRDGDAQASEELLSRIRAEPATTAIQPDPLSPGAVDELVRRRVSSGAAPEFCAACHRATGGNPFLVAELIESLAEDGVEPTLAAAESVGSLVPDAVGRHVFSRLARLPGEALELARGVAVLGDRVALEPAARLAGIAHADAAAGADALIRAGLMRAGPQLEFVHPLIREAIDADLAPGERGRWHRLAAGLLAESGTDDDRVAAQLVASPPAGERWAVDVLRRAASVALGRGAPESAVAYLRRALKETPTDEQLPGVLRELGGAEVQVRVADGLEHLRAALDLADSDPALHAEIAAELALALVQFARQSEAIELLRHELDRAAGARTELRLRLEGEFASTVLFGTDQPLAELDDRLEAIADHASPRSPEGRRVLASRALRLAQRGRDAGRALELAVQVLDRGLLDDVGPGSTVGFNAWATLMCCGALEQAQRWAEAGLRHAQELSHPLGMTMNLNLISWIAYRRGAIREAEATAADSLRLAREHEIAIGHPAVASSMVDALNARGDAAAAWEELARDGFDAHPPPVFTSAWLLEARGRLRASRGDHDGALADLGAAGEWFRRWGAVGPGLSSWRTDAVESLLALGRRDEAKRLADEDLELARGFGAARSLGLALRARALTRDGDDAAAVLNEAASVLGDAGARLELARTLCDLGVVLRRHGERKAAREPLRRARELAHACGSPPLERRAHEELLASGARPRRIPTSGFDSLTPSERRVAQMAAEGLTNREIAQSLFVSLRTVEMHLSRAYRKLEVTSRSALPSALRAGGEA